MCAGPQDRHAAPSVPACSDKCVSTTPHRLIGQFVDITLEYQFAPLLHQPRLQHLGLDLDVVGVSLRTRRPSMSCAQMGQVLQRHILIELALAARSRPVSRQQIDVLPRAAEVPCQLVAGDQHSRMGCTAAPLGLILRHKFGHARFCCRPHRHGKVGFHGTRYPRQVRLRGPPRSCRTRVTAGVRTVTASVVIGVARRCRRRVAM